MTEAVIIVGGPQKDVAKPLFPVAGFPIVHHLVEACCLKVPCLKSVNVIGSFGTKDDLAKYIDGLGREFSIPIRYLCEYTALGTAGGLYHFRDRLTYGDPDVIFFTNGDICGDLAIEQLFDVYRTTGNDNVILTTEVSEEESLQYGCVVIDEKDGLTVKHYVEKPMSFISTVISCGVYVFNRRKLLAVLAEALKNKLASTDFETNDPIDSMEMEKDVLPILVAKGQLKAFQSQKYWGAIKMPSSILIANHHYLQMYENTSKSKLLASPDGFHIIGSVLIDPSAKVHETAVLGPNVCIGKNVVIESGVRVRQAIILDNCVLKQKNSCVLNSILSFNVCVGKWARVEGLLSPSNSISEGEDRLGYRLASQSINVLGSGVRVLDELIVRNVIALPHKELTKSCKDQVVL
ncbi:hypothetical protein ACOME3_007780 [Neoechinorhynchus agilis]